MNVNLRRTIPKIIVFFYLLYMFWYREAIENSMFFLYGGTGIVILATLYFVNKKSLKEFRLPNNLIWWGYYAVFSVFTGVVAVNYQSVISSLITYCAFLLICMCVGIICIGNNEVDWVLKEIIIISIICAIYTIFNGYGYYNGIIVTTMGPNNNPNTLGVFMVFGIFAVLFLDKRSIIAFFISLVLCSLFMYVIILTASKKALLGAVLLLGMWLFVYIKNLVREDKITKLLVFLILFIGLTVAFAPRVVEYYLGSGAYTRMQTLTTSGSSLERLSFYKEAWGMFKKSPLVGVGYKQFMYHSPSGYYSHSTYAEVLSCSGFIGILIFFKPVMNCLKSVYQSMRRKPNYKVAILLLIIIIELFLGSVNIFMYEFSHMLMWTIIYILADRKINCSIC